MSNLNPGHIGRFIILILVQGLFLKNAALFNGLAFPYIYIFFLIKLPIDINRIALLVISFLTGLCMDLFYNTLGLNAAACVLLGFARPGILNAIQPRDGYDSARGISVYQYGFNWFFIYVFSLTLVHHFYLFFLELFSISHLPKTLLKILLSSVYSFLLMLLIHLIFSKKR